MASWRRYRVLDRFLPNPTVSNARVSATSGGLGGRPAVQIEDLPGVYLAGDWVGNEGQMCDASLASARTASETSHLAPAGAR